MSVSTTSVQQAIVEKLTSDADVAAIVDNRILPIFDPEDQNNPAVAQGFMPVVIYDIQESENINTSYANAGNLRSFRMRIVSMARRYADADELAQTVRDALDYQRGTWGSVKVLGCFHENEEDDEIAVTEDGSVVLSAIEQEYTVVISTT